MGAIRTEGSRKEYGVTVYLAGLSSNEFLFDTVLFASFTAATSRSRPCSWSRVAFALAPVSPTLLGALLAGGAALAAVGVALYRRALPKRDCHDRT